MTSNQIELANQLLTQMIECNTFIDLMNTSKNMHWDNMTYCSITASFLGNKRIPISRKVYHLICENFVHEEEEKLAKLKERFAAVTSQSLTQ